MGDSALGHRVGFWNPAVYQFAKMKSSPFTPLNTPGTTNDNLYYSGMSGTLYNPATGLGTPDLAKLAADFAKPGPLALPARAVPATSRVATTIDARRPPSGGLSRSSNWF